MRIGGNIIKVSINTGRRVAQGELIEAKLSKQYLEAVATVEINPEDASEIGLGDGQNCQVESEFGSVVLRGVVDKGISRGGVFIPMGPWANSIIGADSTSTGMPQFKGLEGKIQTTDEKVKSVNELFDKLKKGGAEA